MPDTFDPGVGDLCLYAPWGNLCIFYRDFRESTSLIPLGHIDSGMDVIGGMVEEVKVLSKDELQVTFRNGITITQTISAIRQEAAS